MGMTGRDYFEQWITSRASGIYDVSLDKNNSGNYTTLRVQTRWEAWQASEFATAERCKEIAQQRYLVENQAVEIDDQISIEFGV